jgi:hypothetical protein
VTNVVDVTNNEPLIGFFNVAAVSSEADWLDPNDLPTE